MQIETEHPPIDSAALDWSGNVIYFQIISPRIATEKVYLFLVLIYTAERAM